MKPQDAPRTSKKSPSKSQGLLYTNSSNKVGRGHRDAKLGFRPLKAVLTAEGEEVVKGSRVDYSKLITVEHNTKVFLVGHVATKDCGVLTDAVDFCWAQKQRGLGS